MKRLLLVYLMLCFVFPITIEAKKKPFGNGLCWELTSDGVLTISGTGYMPDFGYYKKEDWCPWHKKSTKILRVVIEDGVKSIGENAFCSKDHLYNLQKIEIPSSIKYIGRAAFWRCRNLSAIVFPNSLDSIGLGAFEDCHALTSIVIPNSVKVIGEAAFCDCINLTSVVISNSLEEIKETTFSGCI